MGKKILIIDYLSPSGHENFDKIHIESLVSLGYEVTIIGKKGQFDKVDNYSRLKIINLPDWCCCKITILAPLLIRIQGILTLFLIMMRYASSKYDYTILICYDILSAFFFRTKSKIILINHNNVGQLDSGIKLKLTLSYNEYIHICLSELMTNKLRELLPSHRVEYVPHGLPPLSKDLHKPIFLNENEIFLFCPINRNFNHKIVANIFNGKELESFLQLNNITLYTKPIEGLEEDGRLIMVLRDHLPGSEYNYLIRNASAVILPYTKEFKYRCSGIFFECVANNTTMLCLNNQDICAYKDKVDMYEFEDVNSLIESIKKCLKKGAIIYDKSQFEPYMYWQSILN